MRADRTRYTIFQTPWGYFGLAVQGESVYRTCLPALDRAQVQRVLLGDLEDMPFEKDLFAELQRRIVAYFEGENVDFSTDPAVCLDDRSAFDRTVLLACRRIGLGQRMTYGELAVEIGKAGAARAVGGAMARNRVPLVIPCHRVVRGDGALGGFSAPGGAAVKQRMLRHEQEIGGLIPDLFSGRSGVLRPTG